MAYYFWRDLLFSISKSEFYRGILTNPHYRCAALTFNQVLIRL
ncbi:MAG: hypothetical protein VSS52_006075 [Thiotrichaceae bacterium]|nr:hypothetical protein [Thiotrichaceae bacterium]